MTLVEKRRVANAREQKRVQILSAAYDALRRTIPSFSTNQKLSKLTILKVAVSYIKALYALNQKVESFENSSAKFARHVNECTEILKTENGKRGSKCQM